MSVSTSTHRVYMLQWKGENFIRYSCHRSAQDALIFIRNKHLTGRNLCINGFFAKVDSSTFFYIVRTSYGLWVDQKIAARFFGCYFYLYIIEVWFNFFVVVRASIRSIKVIIRINHFGAHVYYWSRRPAIRHGLKQLFGSFINKRVDTACRSHGRQHLATRFLHRNLLGRHIFLELGF